MPIEEFFGEDGSKATKHVMASIDNNDTGAEAGTRNHGDSKTLNPAEEQKKGRKEETMELKGRSKSRTNSFYKT